MRTILAGMVTGMALLTVSAGLNHAQATPDSVIQPKSTSPLEIAKAVNRSERLWRQKRIALDVDLTGTWKALGLDAGSFAGCSGDCKATIDRYNLDSNPGREVILKLTQSYNSCRYLIFSHVKSKPPARSRWQLRGYIDHDFNRYQMARHRVVRGFGKNWLVVRGQEGSGSGYSLYGETWYELGKRGVRPVLNYAVEGRTYPGIGGLNWELRSRAAAMAHRRNRQRTVRLDFIVTYMAEGFEDSKFTRRFLNRRHAFYVWNKRTREFVFSGRGSSISDHQMNLIANSETESEDPGVEIGANKFYSGLKGFVGSGFEMFLRLNHHSLMRIARGADNPSKRWLLKFLEQCDNIPEKLALEKALSEQLPQSLKQR